MINKNTENIKNSSQINLLFVGRLVPYKGADMLVEAISKLEPSVQNKIVLTIVGDGSERSKLEQQVQKLNLEKTVFTGWVAHQETLRYYQNSESVLFSLYP